MPRESTETRAHHSLKGGEFYNLDCLEGSKLLQPDSVDLIITDPPYGINGGALHKHYNRREEFVVDGYVDVPSSEYAEFTRKWVAEAARVLKPGGSIYVVSGYTHLFEVINALRQSNLQEINHVIWRFNFGVYTTQKFISSHYHILYYWKPGPGRVFNLDSRYGLLERDDNGGSLNYRDREDVWNIGREYKPGRVKNKNELPLELLLKMLQYSSNEGDTVADFFMGGFSTARAALGINRGFVGFEVSRPIFLRGLSKVKAMERGDLMGRLHRPRNSKRLANQGKPWSDEETSGLIGRYLALIKENRKGQAIETLVSEYGRGRFAIEKVLKRELKPRKKNKQSVLTLRS